MYVYTHIYEKKKIRESVEIIRETIIIIIIFDIRGNGMLSLFSTPRPVF